jgi:hypothetical protein
VADSRLAAVRRALWLGGAGSFGVALAYAPVAAFTGDMLTVTKVGLLGVALLLVARLLPRATESSPADAPPDGPSPPTRP